MNIEITEQLQRILVEHIENSGNGIAVLDAEDRFIFSARPSYLYSGWEIIL